MAAFEAAHSYQASGFTGALRQHRDDPRLLVRIRQIEKQGGGFYSPEER